MFLELLFGNPAVAAAWIAAIFIALTVHEFSHALVAKWRGDLTAEREGRLTLNPIAHIDVMGLIPLLLFGFGWAKPVPFNPYNLKNPKWDSVLIALAGPASNLILATISAILIRVLLEGGVVASINLLIVFLFLSLIINLFLMIFNLVPIHPLDGSKLAFALLDHPKYENARRFIAVRGPQILMAMVFIAILTNLNVFFFVSGPAFSVCDLMLSDTCYGFFAMLFSV
jgi:Zn-dependent protease